MKTQRYGLFVCLCAFFASACADDKPSVAEIRKNSVRMTSAMVRELGQSLEFVQSMQSVKKLTDGLAPMSAPIKKVLPADEPAPLPYPGRSQYAQTAEEEYGPGEAGDDAATEITKVLETYVFADDNLEDSGSDWALFLVKAETVCPKLRDEAVADCDMIDWGCDYVSPPDASCLEGEAADRVYCADDADAGYDACMDLLPRLELRLKVTMVDGDENKLDIELLVGPAKVNPIDLSLRDDSIGVAFDLAAIEATVQHVADVMGGDAPVFPEEFSGVVGVLLKKNADQDFTLSTSITQALIVAGSFDTTEQSCTWDSGTGTENCTESTETHHIAFSSEPADPLFSARAQAVDQKLTFALDINRTNLTLPWAELFDYGNPTGDLKVDLAGFNGEAVLQEGVEALILNGLGLGQGESSVRHDDVALVAVNLNAASGGLFNQLTSIVNDVPVFTFDPSVVLEVTMNLGHITPFLAPEDEAPPAFLCDQTYTLSLLPGASAPALTAFTGNPDIEDDDALKVQSGTLSLASSAAPSETVTVNEGMCLYGVDTVAEGAHELLGHFYGAACQ